MGEVVDLKEAVWPASFFWQPTRLSSHLACLRLVLSLLAKAPNLPFLLKKLHRPELPGPMNGWSRNLLFVRGMTRVVHRSRGGADDPRAASFRARSSGSPRNEVGGGEIVSPEMIGSQKRIPRLPGNRFPDRRAGSQRRARSFSLRNMFVSRRLRGFNSGRSAGAVRESITVRGRNPWMFERSGGTL